MITLSGLGNTDLITAGSGSSTTLSFPTTSSALDRVLLSLLSGGTGGGSIGSNVASTLDFGGSGKLLSDSSLVCDSRTLPSVHDLDEL